MMRREVFTDAQRRLSSLGFKILTDLFASSPRRLRFKELSYTFGTRHAGVSKFDSASAWDYAMLVLDKLVGRYVPVRFLAFSIVGSVGVVVHFAVLWLLFTGLKNTFVVSQAAAIACAMTFNFAVNNLLTYRDRRLRGLRWLRGWITFLLACSLGALMNLGLASSLYRADHAWPLAALGGILVGAVWNYVATTFLTWGRPRA
jgi:dolichol-phosphate mannosyltransferase